jgi:hypothetical protein
MRSQVRFGKIFAALLIASLVSLIVNLSFHDLVASNQTDQELDYAIHKESFVKRNQAASDATSNPKANRAAEAAAKKRRFAQVTQPFPNVSTVGLWQRRFMSGFRNQIMAFSAFVMFAHNRNHSQILLTTLRHKDTHGTNHHVPHEELFDVEHWNSYYPQLPRLVSCDPILYDEFNCTSRKWTTKGDPLYTATRPSSYGKVLALFASYRHYSKGVGPLARPHFRNPLDLLMLRGALRPHPDLQRIVRKLLREIMADAGNGTSTLSYMTLHARIEPDMQTHPMCAEKKVVNLTQLFEMLERKFPLPPAPRVFLPLNRQYLEIEGMPGATVGKNNRTNHLAVENLIALNRAVTQGLWDGTVQVFEFGSNALRGTRYERNAPSTAGALLNFFIAINATVFIGTEVSSWSHDLLATRFYRGNRRNYKYLPDGIHLWTPPEMEHAPGFAC